MGRVSQIVIIRRFIHKKTYHTDSQFMGDLLDRAHGRLREVSLDLAKKALGKFS
jgi:hypothetical protein